MAVNDPPRWRPALRVQGQFSRAAIKQAGLEPMQGHGIRIGRATLEYLLRGVPFDVMKTKAAGPVPPLRFNQARADPSTIYAGQPRDSYSFCALHDAACALINPVRAPQRSQKAAVFHPTLLACLRSFRMTFKDSCLIRNLIRKS
ncbi:hypothetical protein B0H14DRAFT_1496201 [Mycena olivaceomarginata]|nr:hypothetical protein B0H14DRAFT_1496201 [Mycena olivaceomarginata]